MTEILPCPFCGGAEEQPEWIQHKDDCFMWMQATGKKSDMIAAWNRRAQPEQRPVVKLPKKRPEAQKYGPAMFCTGYNSALTECAEAIKAAGCGVEEQ